MSRAAHTKSPGTRTRAASHTLRASASSRRRPLDLRQETIRFNCPSGRHADVTPYEPPYELPSAPEVLTEERLLIARLAVEDYPATTCTALTGGNWFDWLDAIGDDGQTCIAGLVHDLTSEEGDAEAMHVESPLIHGSLFWLRRLDVHPKLRGQEIGARLMAQALWTVRRVSGDLAVLEAFPTESLFDVAAPTRTASAVRRLVSYYERVGFRRSRPSERIRCAAVGMHVQFGTFGLPVLGLPGLSHFPRHLRVSYRGAGATRSTLERPQISGAASATPAY